MLGSTSRCTGSPAASAELDRCPGSVAREEIAGLHADIAFYTGRYRQAELIYRALVNRRRDAAAVRPARACCAADTGSPGEAAALLEAAERRYHGTSPTIEGLAQAAARALALDRGRFDEALALYPAAADALPGWWLVDVHIAEVRQLGGDTAGAQDALRERDRAQRVARAHGCADTDPDRRGPPRRGAPASPAGASDPRSAAARVPGCRGRLTRSTISSGRRRSRPALELAQRNYAARPYGEAAVALARAWLQNAQPKRAVEVLEAHLADGWDTAEVHWVLGEAWAAARAAGRRRRRAAGGARTQSGERGDVRYRGEVTPGRAKRDPGYATSGAVDFVARVTHRVTRGRRFTPAAARCRDPGRFAQHRRPPALAEDLDVALRADRAVRRLDVGEREALARARARSRRRSRGRRAGRRRTAARCPADRRR